MRQAFKYLDESLELSRTTIVDDVWLMKVCFRVKTMCQHLRRIKLDLSMSVKKLMIPEKVQTLVSAMHDVEASDIDEMESQGPW